jgi:hypothetical protein
VDAFLRVKYDLEPARRFLVLHAMPLFVAPTMGGSVVGRISKARSGKQEDSRKG